jgi:hypothetical protein
VGAGALLRSTYNVTASIVNLTYGSADKLYLGAGPALAYGLRLGNDFDLTASLVGYPGIMQSYTLPAGARTLTRWGADANLRGDYGLGGPLFLWGAGHLFVSGSYGNGIQSMLGLGAGAGVRF